MVNLILVAAISSNFIIGKGNELVLTHKEDFQHFKKLTEGSTVIMGRKTYESLPNGPLPNRVNIVISNDKDFLSKQQIDYSTPAYSILSNGVTVIHDIDYYFFNLRDLPKSEFKFYVIGGAQIYDLFLKNGLISSMVITYWNKEAEGDVLFPKFYMNQFKVEKVVPAETTEDFKFFYFTKIYNGNKS